MQIYQTAIVFGATGLVGRELVLELIQHTEYARVKVFVRRKLDFEHDKVVEVITDFEDWDKISESMNGEVVYCCLGTTMRKAGSKDAFRKVDYEMVVKISDLALQKGIEKIAVVSSIGANPKSSNFYLRTKGEMEETIKSSPIAKKIIVRPSMLLGDRKEVRFAEITGKMLNYLFGFLLLGKLKKYKAIKAKQVAKAMVKLVEGKGEKIVFDSDELVEVL